MNVEMIGRRFPHHSTHSGYDRLAAVLNIPLIWHASPGRDLSSYAIPYLNRWYQIESAFQECRLALEDRRAVGITHFLYADQDYRISAFLGPRNMRWLASFHQPSLILGTLGLDQASISGLDAVIIVGESQREFFERHDARSIYKVPHGVDCSFFTPDYSARQEMRVLTVGHWLRDFDLYLKVVTLARRMDLKLQFRLITSTKVAPRWFVPENCTLIANIPEADLLLEYQRASCLFLPLHDATANNTLLEALASGLPYVVSDVGSVRDYVDESGGTLIRTRDPSTWIAALVELSRASSYHFACGASARAQAVNYDWPKIAAQIRQIYYENQS